MDQDQFDRLLFVLKRIATAVEHLAGDSAAEHSSNFYPYEE